LVWIAAEERQHLATLGGEAAKAADMWGSTEPSVAPPTLDLQPINAVLCSMHLSRYNDYDRINAFYQLVNLAVTFEARVWRSKVCCKAKLGGRLTL
jgi:hypothetical protein